MDIKFGREADRARPSATRHCATRRDILAALPALAAGAIVSSLAPKPAGGEGKPLTGAESAELAAEVTKSSWPKPTRFVPGMHRTAAAWRLTRLLAAYAALHSARLGREPSATHMLSVADVISEGRCSWSALGAWQNEANSGFREDRFILAWRRARMIELERRGAQAARLAFCSA